MSRPLVYLITGSIIMLMFDNFHSADEILGHIQRPGARTVYIFTILDL